MGEIAPFRGQGRQISGVEPPICLRSGRFIEISVPGPLISPIPLTSRSPPAHLPLTSRPPGPPVPRSPRRPVFASAPQFAGDPAVRSRGLLRRRDRGPPQSCWLSVAGNKRPRDAYLCRIVGVATNKRLGAA